MKTIAYNEVLFRAAEAAGRTRDNLPPAEAAVLRSVFNLELNRIWASEDWDDLRQPILPIAVDTNKSFANPFQDTSSVTLTGAQNAALNGVYISTGSTGTQWVNGNYSITLANGLYSLADNNGLTYFTSANLINNAGSWTDPNGSGLLQPTSSYTKALMTFGEMLGVFNQDPNGSTPWTRFDFFRTGDSFRVTAPLDHPANQIPAVPPTVYLYWQLPCPDLLALSTAQLNALTLPLVFGNYLALLGAGHLLTADGALSLAGVQFGLARSDLDFQRTRIKRPQWAKQ